jgi:tetratricopeptide (TPR) repeat protein
MPVEKTPPDRLVADTIRQTTEPDSVFQPPAAPHPAQPKSVGGYEILGEIGRGGTGVIYRAFDSELKRYVAIKMLFSGIEVSPYKLSQFRGEAEIVAQLAHPNIVQVFDIGEHDGHPYLALELVEGGSLDRHTERKPQTPRFAAEAVETLARAIHVAHSQHIIHRDLKPANILMCKDGTLKITDFGLAKRLVDTPAGSRTGDIKGTPSYMAPEQADGRVHECGPATDVYALGAILYELLTGRPPFVGADVIETLEQVRLADPPPPSKLVPKVPRDLCTICLKCLEKNPERRYDSAVDLADDLRRWKAGEAILARPVSVVERVARFVRRRPLAAGLVAASAVATGALALLAWETGRRRHEAELHGQAQQHFLHSRSALDEITKLVMDDPQVSRLSGLDPLRSKLLTFYGELVERQMHRPGAGGMPLAEACEKHGKLLDTTGDKKQALVAYAKAEVLYSGLAAGAAPEGEPHHRLALVHLERGKLYRDLGQLPESDAAFAKGLAGLQAMSEAAPDNERYLSDLAEVWHEMGRLFDLSKGKREALGAFRNALALRERLAADYPRNPKHRRDLARSHGFIGDVEMDTVDFPAARRSYRKSLELREAIARESGNEPEALFQLARGHLNFGRLSARERDLPASFAALGRARAIQKELVEGQPAVAEYRSDLLYSSCQLADLLLHTQDGGNRAEAKKALDEAQALYPPSRAAETARADVQGRLAAVAVLKALADIDAAAQPHRPAGALDRQLAGAVQALSAVLTLRDFADDEFALAQARALRAELAGGDASMQAEAVAALRKAIAANYRGKHPDDLAAAREFRGLSPRTDFQGVLGDYTTRWGGRPATARVN